MKKFVVILLMMWHVFLSGAAEELMLINHKLIYQGIQESIDTLSCFGVSDAKESDNQELIKLKKILKAVSIWQSMGMILSPEESNNEYLVNTKPFNHALISTICTIKKNKKGASYLSFASDNEIKEKKYTMIDVAIGFRDYELLSLVMDVAGKFYTRTDYLNSIFRDHRLYMRGQFIDIGNSYDSHESHMKDIWFYLAICLYAHPHRDAFIFPMIEFLAKDGIDINMQNQDGKTALHFVLGTTPEFVDKFMKFKPDVHIRDNQNRTLLHYAVDYRWDGYNSREMIKKVLDTGVDIHVRDTYGTTALDYAIRCNKSDHIKLLQDRYYQECGLTLDNVKYVVLNKGCTIS